MTAPEWSHASPVMATRSKSLPVAVPSLDPLSVNELLFVNAFQTTGFRDRVHAYLDVFPKSKRQSAKISVCRMLMKANVQAEIVQRIASAKVMTKHSLTSDLHKYKTWAEQGHDYDSASEITFKLARLGGFLIDRSEVTTLTDQDRTAIDALVSSCLQTRHTDADNGSGPRATPTGTPSAGTGKADGVTRCTEDITKDA